MRMCPTTCARWAYAAEGIEPAMERVDGVWRCEMRVLVDKSADSPVDRPLEMQGAAS
jgi:hypothetical protein